MAVSIIFYLLEHEVKIKNEKIGTKSDKIHYITPRLLAPSTFCFREK